MSSSATTFGRYRLLREIGRGGEATVHLAEDTVLGRNVALKVFPPAMGPGPAEPPAGFKKEVEVLSRLRHPGICTILDAGISEGSAFISMSYVEGRSLADRRRIDAAEAVRIAADVADTLAAAHAASIVHGDLTPRNVLLTPDGRTIVLDFGVATFLDASLPASSRLAGTLPYLAPERLHHPPAVASDVFGLGAILFELVSGRTPFSAPTRAALTGLLAREQAPLLRSVTPRAPRDLEAVLAKALERDPARRYATMAAFGADLRHVRDGEPVSARRYGLLARAARVARRRRAAAALVVVLALFLTIAVPLAAVKHHDLGRNLDQAAAQEQRATTDARAAEDNLHRFERLADIRRIRDLEDAARKLVPPGPAIVPALRAWLADAEQLARGLDAHRAALAAVHARSRPGSEPVPPSGHAARLQEEVADLRRRLEDLEGGSPAERPLRRLIEQLASSLPAPGSRRSYASDSDAWHEETLTGLVEALEHFTDPDRFRGVMADVAHRVEEAHLIEDTRTRSAQAWDAACRSIADEARCPRYHGLGIVPQEGLVPLRRDPASGLWEFLHVLSGKRPGPAGGDAWTVRPETGIVLVLLPGGRARMGARRPANGELPDQPYVDPQASPEASPLDDVALDPFFISKFEMTGAQWARVTGTLPGSEERDAARRDPGAAGVLPVTLISWTEARAALARIGLELPTEAQWEYAARAGTTTPWWTGSDEALLARAAVFSARSPEPVGGRPANAYGLHDVAGNVAEWCRDVFARYDDPREPGTGERRGLDESEHRIRRGGGFPSAPNELRSARRNIESPAARLSETGVRPARRLER